MARSSIVGVLAITLVSGWGLLGCRKAKESQTQADVQQEKATPAKSEAQKRKKVVAIVNGVKVPGKKFYEQLDKITQNGKRNIPEERLKRIEKNILDRLVEEELIRQEVKRQGITVSDKEVQEEFEKFKGRFRSEKMFKSYLERGKTSEEEIKSRLRARLALEHLLKKMGKLTVTEKEIEDAYKTGIRMYTEPEQIHAQHILIRVSRNAPKEKVEAAKKKAMSILKQLRKGADFGELAKKYSEDPGSKGKGGDLGFFRRGTMVPEFDAAVASLKPGENSKKPVRTAFGFHIIKVLEKKPERVKPLEEVKDRIERSLRQRKMFKARRELVQNLRKNANIKTFVE